MKWFRLYTDILDDVKMKQLTALEFNFWIKLMALCSELDEHSEYTGRLSGVTAASIGWRLRVKRASCERYLSKFKQLGMVHKENGEYVLSNWAERQFKSDNSYERVKRFRNVTVTANETAPDTDTDTDTEKNKTIGHFPFEEIWKRYPRKDGKKEAERHFNASVITQEDWENINIALNHYLEDIRIRETEDNYIKKGATWFNNWKDWAEWEEPDQPKEKNEYNGPILEDILKRGAN